MASRRSSESVVANPPSWMSSFPPGFRDWTMVERTELESSFEDSVRVLSASRSTQTMSYVAGGRLTKERERRSSIWMSVAERSWAATRAFRRSGWLDREGGESRRVRGADLSPLLWEVEGGAALKSELLSRATEGAIMTEVLFLSFYR